MLPCLAHPRRARTLLAAFSVISVFVIKKHAEFTAISCVRFSHLCANAPLVRSEEHTSELQSLRHLVCRLLLEKKKKKNHITKSHKVCNIQPARSNLH